MFPLYFLHILSDSVCSHLGDVCVFLYEFRRKSREHSKKVSDNENLSVKSGSSSDSIYRYRKKVVDKFRCFLGNALDKEDPCAGLINSDGVFYDSPRAVCCASLSLKSAHSCR